MKPTLVHCWGFSQRKLGLARRFLPDCKLLALSGHRAAARLAPGSVLALWGAAAPPPGLRQGVAVWRLEDGFLRSVGLGADLVRPLSWVVDRSGIYFDPRQVSDLETLLAGCELDAGLLARAKALRAAIVEAGLTKYNVGAHPWVRPQALRDGQAVVLVVGQVESDASIRLGTGELRSNLALLQAVRADRPDAWLVYKPHPDVLAGLRSGRAIDRQTLAACDEVVGNCAMAGLLDAVDEVHVMTSLAGFEALLRGKAVTTYGMPFYAGWGLTRDLGLSEDVGRRRSRRLELEQLVAAALILYPVYVDPDGRISTPEAALAQLAALRRRGAHQLPWWRSALRPLLGAAARLRGG